MPFKNLFRTTIVYLLESYYPCRSEFSLFSVFAPCFYPHEKYSDFKMSHSTFPFMALGMTLRKPLMGPHALLP